jgi:hypothetical protein
MTGSNMATGCDVTESHATPKEFLGRVGCAHARPEVAQYPPKWGFSPEGWCARMRNIRLNVTRRASPGKYGSVHARSEVHLGCDLICSQTQPKRGLK